MIITLLNYTDEKVDFDIGNLDDILYMNIEVLSGDEILTVTYSDFSTKRFDSDTNGRCINYYDDSYRLYDFRSPNDSILNSEAWKNRTSSYWR